MFGMPVFRLLLLFLFCGIITSAWSSALPTHVTNILTNKTLTNILTNKTLTNKTLTNTLTNSPLWNPRHPRQHFYSFLSAARTSLSTTSRVGNTYDNCETDTDCLGERRCINFGDGNKLCAGEDGCVCAPPNGNLVPCTDSLVCEEGETCASLGNTTYPFCLSDDFIRDRGYTVVFGPPGNGYTLDLCSDTSDCRAPRKCMLSTNLEEPCEDRDHCACATLPLTECCPDECIPQEVCVQITEGGSTPFCASPLEPERRYDMERTDCASSSPTSAPSPTQGATSAQSPSPTPTSSPLPPVETDPPRLLPCISTHLLEHLSESELLFKKHVWSNVLCDAQMSCATPGHVVVFKDQVMMMGSYCKIVGCNGRVMQVNSPRYRKKHRVRSMTEGLEFTVFAARYETMVEEHIIALAVKMGL